MRSAYNYKRIDIMSIWNHSAPINTVDIVDNTGYTTEEAASFLYTT